MKVLSLFDGISGCRQALKELNIDCEYYASEIDKYSIQIAKANHPDINHIGDVKNIYTDYTGKYPWQILRWGENGDMRYTSSRPPSHKESEFDLLIGGSPCQDLSIAKKDRKGLKGDRSSLFYEYVRILNEVKPKYFILENVASMSKESKEIITKELFNIDPVMINSGLLTAQNRKRLYWVGKLVNGEYEQVKIGQPEDKEIYLKDIIEGGVVDTAISGYFNKVKYEIIKKSYQKRVNKIPNEFNKYLKESRGNLTYKEVAINLDLPLSQAEHYFRTDKSRAIPSINNYKKIKKLLNLNNEWDNLVMDFETKQSTYEQNLRLYNINGKSPTLTLSCNVPIRLGHFNKGGQGDRIYSVDGKSVCLSANGGGRGAKTGLYDIDKVIRKLTPTECCRLQGFPDNYVSMVSKTQGYKGLGNSFTVPVINHILTNLK
tara:strand:- start:528 stop:1823 length:1296 start_codon:yes stop_codon:yes gene_type:complete